MRVETVSADGVPAAFGWQGQTHAVERLVQRWEVETDWWAEEGETRRLFVTLIPSADAPSAAEDLPARFTRVWTPERLAA